MVDDHVRPLIERLRKIDTCAVSDALDAIGITGVIERVGRVSGGDRTVVGRVITVQLGPTDGTTSSSHLCTAAIESGGAGDVLLVDHQWRSDCAGWGGNLSRAAQVKGLEATIVVGAARDVDESRSIGYTVYASAPTPVTARGRAREIRWGDPLVLGGVTARSGDVLVADGSGVVLIPIDRLADVVATAEQIVVKERLIADAIARGEAAGIAMGANYEEMLKEMQ
jgi:4-hydroxy-4-methyl-2-oxoglutarate aldolase